MTTHTAHLLVRTPRRGLRAHPLLVVALVALAALATVAASAPVAPSSGVAPPRVALVVDAGARPSVTLARAGAVARSADRSGSASVAVRVPRTPAEAAADVRYFAAQPAVDRVVTVGPVSGGAARAAA